MEQEIRLLQFAIVHIRENLLGAGCGVDMNTLTKSFITNHKNNSYSRHREFGFGVEFPIRDFEFNRGECR